MKYITTVDIDSSSLLLGQTDPREHELQTLARRRAYRNVAEALCELLAASAFLRGAHPFSIALVAIRAEIASLRREQGRCVECGVELPLREDPKRIDPPEPWSKGGKGVCEECLPIDKKGEEK